uniref:MULE domain-containing protein n=1 Tax=Globodera pallida TaxID=36090 RepID=A0A183C4G3_GLOPA
MVNLEKTASRQRNAMGLRPAIPHSLSEFVIPDELRRTRTAREEPFVMADTGMEDPARIVIFGCRTDFHRLAQCSTGKVMPFVYALLPNKQQRTYERALERILSGIDAVRPGWRPTTLVIDFEKAEMNAFERFIPGVATHGCLLREQVRVDFTCTRLEAGEQVAQFSRIEYRQANERLLALIG